MAENLFTDYPDRIAQLTRYTDVYKIGTPIEAAFGEQDFFESNELALESYKSILNELGKFCGAEVKGTAAEIDRVGATLKEGEVNLPSLLVNHVKRFSEMGMFGALVSRANGGLNIPQAVHAIALEMLAQACPNTALTVATYSMATFLEAWGTKEQITRILPKLISGEWRSSMALTESNAGSDLGALRTHARREGARYIINGSKIFISSGAGEVTFALVRTDPKSIGLNGLSVLIVPRKIDGKDNYRVTKIEDKICLHASPTCELIFENSIGELLGPEGQGFKVMLDLMNDARLAMSCLAIGIAVGALEEAKKYAGQRVSMGKPIIRHPMIADMIFEMEMEIRAMRAMVSEASMAYDWMRIAKHNGDEKTYKKWRKRYRRLTPLCKYHCAEKAITITRNAVQIFGGYGVCKEYPVERLFREAIIFPIYEGTSQIQSLMVLKDTLKDISENATRFLGSLAGTWAEAKITSNPVKSKLLQARNELNLAIRSVLVSIIREKFKMDIESLRQTKIQEFLRGYSLNLLSNKGNFDFPLLVAERLTRITCDYYALKCLIDHLHPKDVQRELQILDFAELSLPRMRLENAYINHRLPATLDYVKPHRAQESLSTN